MNFKPPKILFTSLVLFSRVPPSPPPPRGTHKVVHIQYLVVQINFTSHSLRFNFQDEDDDGTETQRVSETKR